MVARRTWTNKQIQEIKDLWQSGYSAGRIAANIGRTKNSVLGQIHRRRASEGSNQWPYHEPQDVVYRVTDTD